MNDVILKLILPGGSIAAAGVLALVMNQEATVMASDFQEPPVTASQLALTEVKDTAAPTRVEPVFPAAPAQTETAIELTVPKRALPVSPTIETVVPTSDAAQATSPKTPVLDQKEDPAPIVDLAANSDTSVSAPTAETPVAEVADTQCDVTVRATARAAAMMTVTVDAPCAPNTRVEIWHEDLVLAGVTNDMGDALINVPALASPALIRAGLADGTGATTQVEVPDLREYHRAVLQTGAAQDLEIHVLEGEADYDTDGHIHLGNPRTIAHALSGNGGFLTFLGDPGAPQPRLAQAYTFPKTAVATYGTPVITVEAAITQGNCGQIRTAGAIQSKWGKTSEMMEINLELPDCDAAGELLLLPGIFDVQQVASN